MVVELEQAQIERGHVAEMQDLLRQFESDDEALRAAFSAALGPTSVSGLSASGEKFLAENTKALNDWARAIGDIYDSLKLGQNRRWDFSSNAAQVEQLYRDSENEFATAHAARRAYDDGIGVLLTSVDSRITTAKMQLQQMQPKIAK